ncbi:MAG: hypothetical protein Q6370_002830 [Candidatus Sigynarchaeota archaeon]
MPWDVLVIDEKEIGETRTKVMLVDDHAKNQETGRILAETRDDYEHLDACMNPGKTRAIVLKMQDVNSDRDEFIDVYDPITLKPILSLTNWPVDKISFSKDGKLMFLQAKLETGTPIEVVLDITDGHQVDGGSRNRERTTLVTIADLLKKRKRIEKRIT